MNLHQALKAELEASTSKTRCKLGNHIQSLNAADQAALREALNNPAWSGSALARALGRMKPPFKIGEHSVTRHRRGDCHCSGES